MSRTPVRVVARHKRAWAVQLGQRRQQPNARNPTRPMRFNRLLGDPQPLFVHGGVLDQQRRAVARVRSPHAWRQRSRLGR